MRTKGQDEPQKKKAVLVHGAADVEQDDQPVLVRFFLSQFQFQHRAPVADVIADSLADIDLASFG